MPSAPRCPPSPYLRREAQELLTFAASLGMDLPAVEMALVLSNGDWDAARLSLQQQAEQAVVNASMSEAGASHALAMAGREEADLAAALQLSASTAAMQPHAAAAAAAAREQAELEAALQLSASTAAMHQQSAAAAAAAREQAELDAAIQASQAEAAARQQWQQPAASQAQFSLPWAPAPAGAEPAPVSGGWPGAGSLSGSSLGGGSIWAGSQNPGGGWDAAPAPSSGRSSTASTPLPPAPGVQPQQAVSQGGGLTHVHSPSSAASASTAAAPHPWTPAPAPAIPSVVFSSHGNSSTSSAARQPDPALAAAVAAAQPAPALPALVLPAAPAAVQQLQQKAEPESELDELMAMMGLAG